MLAVYKEIDSEGRPFTWTLDAQYFNGVLYVRHWIGSPWYVATGIAAPDYLIED
jgi:hypothetical protein